MNLIAAIILGSIALLALVALYFIARMKKAQELKWRLDMEFKKLSAFKLKFQVLDSKTHSYKNSLGVKHNKMLDHTRDMFLKLDRILNAVDSSTISAFPQEVECMLDILNDHKNKNVGKVFDLESDEFKTYEALRGWDKNVNSYIHSVGQQILKSSQNFKSVKPERHQRNDTIVELARIGITRNDNSN